MNIFETTSFTKKVKKLDAKIYKALKERMMLFASEPRHPLLNNHKLAGDRKHQRSINITGDWRLVYEPRDAEIIWLIDIDTHPNLYGK